MHLTIAELTERFPSYEVAVVVVRGAEIVAERAPALARKVEEAEAAAIERYNDVALSDIPEIKDWREAYKGFGIKSTSYRSSVERLLRSVLKGRGLPRINALVDAYNCVSLRYLLPVGADDLAKVTGGLAFRFARPGDSFIALGDAEGREDPPKEGEVVYADSAHVLCRRWNWYQDARSAVSAESRDIVLTVQGQGAGDPRAAAEELCADLVDLCGGSAEYRIASASQPSIELP